MSSFIKVQGKKLVRETKDQKTQPISFVGIGLGSWLNMEHYMIDMPGCDSQIRRTVKEVLGEEDGERFFDLFVRNFVGEEDFQYLKSLGINLVRVPMNYRLFIDDNARRTGDGPVYLEKGFAYFDYLLNLGEKYGIYVLPELHTAPGGQNPDWHSDNATGYTLFWQYGALRREFALLWGEIARRYKDREYLLGYDLLNEPFVIPELLTGEADKNDLSTGIRNREAGKLIWELYEECTREIRKTDHNHVIFLEGDHFAADFSCLPKEIPDKQTALTFHFYPTVWQEDLYEDKYSDEERDKRFREIMDKLLSGLEPFHRPVLCGEAGYEIRTQGIKKVLPMIRSTLQIFKDYDIPFTLWSYKDTGFMGMVYPKETSAWSVFAKRIGMRWSHHWEMDYAKERMKKIRKDHFPEMTPEEEYVLHFRERAVLYPLEEKYILTPAIQEMGRDAFLQMPEDLAFRNCESHEEFAKLFSEIFVRKQTHFPMGG